MKKQTTKILVLLLAFILTQCQNEDNLDLRDSNSSTVAAQKWFSNYLTQGDNYALFDDLQYEWDKATTITLDDGSKAITVPVIEPFTNTTYTGKKLLYVYLMEDNNYKALLFQFSPKEANQPIKDIQTKLKDFDGTISIWDLKTGFLEGATFEDNLLKNELVVKPIFDKTNLQLGMEKYAPVGDTIYLAGVIIRGGGGSGTSKVGLYYFPSPTPSSTPSSTPKANEYTNKNRGGSGGGTKSGSKSPSIDEEGDTKKADDPCSKLKEQLADKAFKDQLDALKKNYSLKNETGFKETLNGEFVKQDVAGQNSIKFEADPNQKGYAHVHTNGYENEFGEPVEAIKIFSPEDVRSFLGLLGHATRQGRSLDDVYGIVTSSAGTYSLRFNGTLDLAKANSLVFDNAMLTKYLGYFKNDKNIESAFLSFLQNEIGINGISLYKANDDGTFEQKRVNATTGEVTKTPCN
jgi:hypothetical protein